MLLFMNIAIEKLLAKMESELHMARNSSKGEHLREKVYSIKILCELILEEQTVTRSEAVGTMPHVVQVHQPQPQPAVMQVQPISSVGQAKKLQTDDGANGDSLFDF